MRKTKISATTAKCKLNDAYDEDVRMSNEEEVKRLSMSTTTRNDDAKVQNPITITNTTSSKKKAKKKWKAGMHCRAVYEEDRVEYEAFLIKIINEKECVVRFLGYDNTEIVPVGSLRNSLGKRERTQQIQDALAESFVNGLSDHDVNGMECSDAQQCMTSTASLKKNKEKKMKGNKQKLMNVFDLPEMSTLLFPNLTQLRNMGIMDMPIPPPPPAISLTQLEVDSEDKALSSMLFSWYVSGYYTGLYQGMKRAGGARTNSQNQ